MDSLGRCPRLLWVVSRATCRLVCYYWLIICLFPRASAAASGGVWGSAPRRFCFLNLGFMLSQNVSSSWLQGINDVSSSAFCYPRKVPNIFASTPSRNLTFVSWKRNEQLNLKIGFIAQPGARACAVPKRFFVKSKLSFLLSRYARTLSRSPSSCAVLRPIAIRHKSIARRRATATIAFLRAAAP
jgi:hypothetical protein